MLYDQLKKNTTPTLLNKYFVSTILRYHLVGLCSNLMNMTVLCLYHTFLLLQILEVYTVTLIQISAHGPRV